MANWCRYYGCWCSDVEEITDGQGDCDYDCEDCDDREIIKSQRER